MCTCRWVNSYFFNIGKKLLAAHIGSNVIVAGSAIFGASDPEGVIAVLKASVEKALHGKAAA